MILEGVGSGGEGRGGDGKSGASGTEMSKIRGMRTKKVNNMIYR